MDKLEVKHQIQEELLKENWNSQLVEELINGLHYVDQQERVLSKISDELPKIAARVCGVSVLEMAARSRKEMVILALKFVYKELYDHHGYTYQRLADRFNRKDHSTVMSAIETLDNAFEVNDRITTTLYNKFRYEVDAFKTMISV
jgi:chromosomal replication initiation ATPase DnaA